MGNTGSSWYLVRRNCQAYQQSQVRQTSYNFLVYFLVNKSYHECLVYYIEGN